MKTRLSILAGLTILGSLAALLATDATSQLGVAKGYVNLQSTTPGTSQSGHSNISGTARAAQFVGGGAGLTGVNADLLDGLNSSAFLSGPPLNLSGNNHPAIVNIDQSSSVPGAFGVRAFMSSTTSPSSLSAALAGYVLPTGNATAVGVYGYSYSGRAIMAESTDGTAVVAKSTAINGQAVDITSSGTGVQLSSVGVGVNITSTNDHGMYSASNTRAGVIGWANSISTSNYGVEGYTFSDFSGGVLGLTHSQFNQSSGVRGIAQNANATGVLGEARGANGRAVVGTASATSGNGVGVLGQAASQTGYGVRATNTGSGFALYVDNRTFFGGDVEFGNNARIRIGGTSAPIAPIDLDGGFGTRISLNGTVNTSSFGFGVQTGLLQVIAPSFSDGIGIGYGTSTSFTERARFVGNGEMALVPSNQEFTGWISGPADLVFSKDRDNDSLGEWTRFLTNGGIEQVRIEGDDEAITRFDGAVISNGIDYAEAFKVFDPTLEPGDLVVNAGSSWEFISRSSVPYDNAVIGVISTKPAFVAGLSFDAEDQIDPALTRRRDEARKKGDHELERALTLEMKRKAAEAHRPVAFMGRVPVKVVGPVKVGDHLTSSHIPGVAMAMTQPGHSIGIALEANSSGSGMVMGMIQPRYYGGAEKTSALMQLPEIVAMKNEMEVLRAENRELRERLERVERLLMKR